MAAARAIAAASWLAGTAALALFGAGCRGEAEAQPEERTEERAETTTAMAKVDEVRPMAAPRPEAAVPALAVPASWKPMPEASRAMEEKLTAAKLANATTAAWGDAARGCYAIQISAMERAVRLADVAAGLRAGFGLPAEKEAAPGSAGSGSAGSGSAATASGSAGSAAAASGSKVPPANAGSADLQFQVAPPLTGTMRVRLRDDGAATRLSAAACFYHPRYPEQCQRHCERALSSLEAP